MSNFLQKFKDYFNKIRVNNRSYSRNSIMPSHDWGIILFLSIIIFIFLASLSYYFYKKVNQGKLFFVKKDESQKEVKINSAILQRVVNDINYRETIREKIEKGEIKQTDPSL